MKNILFAFVLLFASGALAESVSFEPTLGAVISPEKITSSQIEISCQKSGMFNKVVRMSHGVAIIEEGNNVYTLNIPGLTTSVGKLNKLQSCAITLSVQLSNQKVLSAILVGSNGLMEKVDIAAILDNSAAVTAQISKKMNPAEVKESATSISGYKLELNK